MTVKKIVVSGAAGYLGRITSRVLLREGYEPIGLDNFSTSHRLQDKKFKIYETELCDLQQVRKTLKSIGKIDGIIHFAAKALVPESCEFPEMYFTNNLNATIHLAQLAVECQIPYFVHSSSCAVYGVPKSVPISEESEQNPVSPYGESKVIAEKILNQFAIRKGLSVLNLRYFNPGGAFKDEGEWIGEAHDPETHLIPNLVKAVLEKKALSIFGSDYETKDGTCVRDYIHVEDLARAHVAALAFLKSKPKGYFTAINVGSGTGTSIHEVVQAAKRVLDPNLKVEKHDRRPGDPPELISKTEKATKELKFTPQKSLDEILKSQLEFIRSH